MTTSKRRNPFAQPADPWDGANDPLATIRMPEKKKRERKYEAENKACVYRIPENSQEEAQKIRANLKSIVANDESGNPRADRTTVDDVATVLMDYALTVADEEGLTFSPTRKGRMSLNWKKIEQGWASPEPIELKKVSTKEKKATSQMLLGYRWSSEIHARIEALAGVSCDVSLDENGRRINNPHRYQVPIGEVVVRLLQRGISDYVSRKIHLNSSQETVTQKVTGWAK